MSQIDILEEKPLTLVETKAVIEKIKKKIESTDRIKKTEEYLNKFTKKAEKDFKSIKDKLNKLEISRLKDRHIAKMIDIRPKDIDSLRTVLSGENVTFKQEDMQKILECLK